LLFTCQNHFLHLICILSLFIIYYLSFNYRLKTLMRCINIFFVIHLLWYIHENCVHLKFIYIIFLLFRKSILSFISLESDYCDISSLMDPRVLIHHYRFSWSFVQLNYQIDFQLLIELSTRSEKQCKRCGARDWIVHVYIIRYSVIAFLVIW